MRDKVEGDGWKYLVFPRHVKDEMVGCSEPGTECGGMEIMLHVCAGGVGLPCGLLTLLRMFVVQGLVIHGTKQAFDGAFGHERYRFSFWFC